MTHAIHSTLSLMAGDDWVIMGTLLATDGAPVDLTNASIIWGMVGMDGHLVVLDDDPDDCRRGQNHRAARQNSRLVGGLLL